MDKSKQLTKPKNGYLRIRLSLNSNQLCYRHLHGKTEVESRAWAVMALEYVASLQDMAGKEGNSGIDVVLPVAVPTKRARGKATPQPLKTPDAATIKAVSPIRISEKVQDDGNYLAVVRAGW